MNKNNFAPNWKRIGARCTDIGLNIIFLIIVTVIYNLIIFGEFQIFGILQVIQQLILLSLQFIIFLIYFVVISTLTKGQTLGKKIFSIRLITENKNKIPMRVYFFREFYILVLPLIISYLLFIIFSTIFSSPYQSQKLAANFLFFWFFFLFLFQKINKNHCLFYDRFFQIFVVNDNKKIEKEKLKIFKNFFKSTSMPTNTDKIFEKLNKEQMKAVVASDQKNALIIAGPGTGKTTVLIHKIIHLIKHYRLLPWRILVLTFTKKAALNVRDRLNKKIKLDTDKYQIYTYHGFCYSFLLEEINWITELKNLVVMDETDQKNLVKSLIMEIRDHREKKLDATTLKTVISFINLKNRKLIQNKKKFSKLFTEYTTLNQVDDKFIDFIWTISLKYSDYKKNQGLMDFNDLLIETYNLLKNNVNLLKKWQKRFDAILIDEFQDTSYLQYRLIELLTSKGKEIKTTVIGDPDQTIYGWRDAKIEFILNFCKNFSPAEEINLVKNYRSTIGIVNVAKQLIRNNENRSKGALEVVNFNNEKVKIFYENGRYTQANTIVSEIEELIEDGANPKSIAILYRSHFLSGALENFLVQKKISYVIFKGVRFFLRLEIKDMINSLSLFSKPRDFNVSSILLWIKGLGATSVIKIQKMAKAYNLSIFELIETNDLLMVNTKTRTAIKNLFGQIPNFKKLMQKEESLLAFTKQIFDNFYKPFFDQNYLDKDWRIKHIETFLDIVDNFDKMNLRLSLKEKIHQFLNEIKISTDADFIKETDSISLMTIHNAKGLEFDHVFVFDVSQEIFPTKKSELENLEEERRIFFVALTRAKKKLFIFTNIFNQSIFIDEIEDSVHIEKKKGYF